MEFSFYKLLKVAKDTKEIHHYKINFNIFEKYWQNKNQFIVLIQELINFVSRSVEALVVLLQKLSHANAMTSKFCVFYEKLNKRKRQ